MHNIEKWLNTLFKTCGKNTVTISVIVVTSLVNVLLIDIMNPREL